MTADQIIDAVRALGPVDGSLAPGADDEELDAVERDLGRPLPADVRELLRRSNGIGADRSTGCYLDSTVGLRRHAGDDSIAAAYPGALIVGDDGSMGLYLVDIEGRFGTRAGGVLLIDRSWLGPERTIVAGASVSDVFEAVLAGEDLWARPKLA